MNRVLIVEDEQHIAAGLRFNLEAEGYEAEVVQTGEEALDILLAQPSQFDVMVLDVMLPGKDGFSVISEARQAGQLIPTLMLTARGHSSDVLKGFAAGADDYLPKPFELAILLARVRGLLRRRNWLQAPQNDRAPENIYRFGDDQSKTVNFDLLDLCVGDQTFRLTLMEADMGITRGHRHAAHR
jgi:DNA-binding response OmpR family regulator